MTDQLYNLLCSAGLAGPGSGQEIGTNLRFGPWSATAFSERNCAINVMVRGEWYSRDQNEDQLTNIDATTMTGRGTCKAFREDNAGNYQVRPAGPVVCNAVSKFVYSNL